MSKILVSGATGTIGRQVTLALARAGADVRAGVRDPQRARDLADAGAELVHLDWSEPQSIREALTGVERLFLLTPFVEDPMDLAHQVLSLAREAGVKHVVRLSAVGADPSSDFGLAKLHGLIEQAVKDSGMSWTVVQPTFFLDNFIKYGPAQTIKAEGRFYGSSGQGRTSYVSSEDVGAVAAAALRDPEAHAGKTYVLTGGESVTDAEMATLFSELLGTSVAYVDLTPEQQRGALEQQGAPGWMIDSFVGLESVKRNGWAEAISPVVSQVLGRSPRSPREFLSEHLDAFR